MIETIVLFGHLLVAGLIIALVLLQRGKGAEAGTGFGAGASGTVFGSRGSASFFSRATAVLATLFFATSLALAYFSTQTSAPEALVGDPGPTSETPAVGPTPGEAPEIAVPDEPAGDGAVINPATIGAGGDDASQ